MTLNIIYRACSIGNPEKERPIEDRYELLVACFTSLKIAFASIPHHITVLLDKPTDRYRNIYKGEDVQESFYSDFSEGNTKSFHKQLDLAIAGEDIFLLVEDDYLFLPHAGEIIYKTLTETEDDIFITPYDHPDYYNVDTHAYDRAVKVIGMHHWGSVNATTLTFGGKKSSLLKEYEVMKRYGWADYPMWLDVTQRIPLYAPLPSLATHMETLHMAPLIDWLENL